MLYGTEKAPASKGERLNESDIKAAFFRGADPTITDEEMDGLWEDARNYIMYKISQRSRKDKDGQ